MTTRLLVGVAKYLAGEVRRRVAPLDPTGTARLAQLAAATGGTESASDDCLSSTCLSSESPLATKGVAGDGVRQHIRQLSLPMLMYAGAVVVPLLIAIALGWAWRMRRQPVDTRGRR